MVKKKKTFKLSLKTFFLGLIALFLFANSLSAFFNTGDRFSKAKQSAGHWPFWPATHLNLALCFFETGDLQSAKKELTFAKSMKLTKITVYLFPFWKNDFLKLEEKLNLPDKLEEKQQFWQRTLQNKPNYRDAYLNLSLVYYQQKKDDLALEAWQKAFYLDPNNPVIQSLGEKIINRQD